MTHELNPIEDHTAGETVEHTITIYDEDDENSELKDLSGAEVEWVLVNGRQGEAVLDHTDTGVTVAVTDAVGGQVTVTFANGATEGLGGEYTQIVTVWDNADRRNVYTGVVAVERLLG